MLIEEAFLHLPVRQWTSTTLSRACWDSVPFVLQLASAALFFPGGHPWSEAARLACGAVAGKLGSPSLLEATFDKFHLQRFLYTQMLPSAYPDCLAGHLAKHIAALVDLNPAHLIGTTVLDLVNAAVPF